MKHFIRLLTSLVHGSTHTKCVSLSNQKCMTQPTLNDFLSLIQSTIHSQMIQILLFRPCQ